MQSAGPPWGCMQTPSIHESSVLVGIDLGGSGFRVRRARVERAEPLELAMVGDATLGTWPRGFEPVPLEEQLLELEVGGMRLADAETRAARDRIGRLWRAIAGALGRVEPGRPVLLGIAAAGLCVHGERGLGAVRNGPRIPDLCARLEQRLEEQRVALARPLWIASDGLAQAAAERHARGGLLRDVQCGAALAGGSGLAEGFVLGGRLRAIDGLEGLERAWRMRDARGLSFEDRIAPGRVNARWKELAGAPGPAGKERVEVAAARGVEEARALLADLARALAQLVRRRAEELERLAPGQGLERVVLGGALGRILAGPQGRPWRERIEAELGEELGARAPARALSALEHAPALGAIALALSRAPHLLSGGGPRS